MTSPFPALRYSTYCSIRNLMYCRKLCLVVVIYLGSLFTSDGRGEQDVRRRIGIAKLTFISMEKVLKDRNIYLQLKIRMFKCYVWATLQYGRETWRLSVDMMKQIETVDKFPTVLVPIGCTRQEVGSLHSSDTT